MNCRTTDTGTFVVKLHNRVPTMIQRSAVEFKQMKEKNDGMSYIQTYRRSECCGYTDSIAGPSPCETGV